MKESRKDQDPQQHAPDDARKPYAKPALQRLGSLSDLTAGGSGNRTEDDPANDPPQPSYRP
jgi:hypothetical protein